MSSTKVIVVGCGIAGPVLATFLKLKGYEPVVYERTTQDTEAGLGLMWVLIDVGLPHPTTVPLGRLQANGLRVLSLIPGIIDDLPGKGVERFSFFSTVPGNEGILAESDIPVSHFRQKYGFKPVGVQRTKFQHLIAGIAEKRGVPIFWEHKVVGIEQGDDYVRVEFENGKTDTASFVVGCDGLHSNTRGALFGREQATFTGLTQTGGISPTPKPLRNVPRMANFFGEGSHIVAYPTSDTHTSWAISQREAEAKETWRHLEDEAKTQVMNSSFADWPFGAGDLVKNAEKITKYGLYDRPELKKWHKGRVVLLGDAAHPTSPHLGQGANQAFEDIYHLIRLLVKHNPGAGPPSTTILSNVFWEYETLRLPRTSELVKGARKMGETRVMEGYEACVERDRGVKTFWMDEEAACQTFELTLNGPFTGPSEI